MKHYSHQKQQIREDLSVEFAQEFGLSQSLDQESHQAFLSAKEGGMVTKKLSESVKKMRLEQSNLKK